MTQDNKGICLFQLIKVTGISRDQAQLFSNYLHYFKSHAAIEPRCEKTGLRGFRPGPTQTRLYSY